MPTKYKGKTYLTFNGLKKAVKRDHPSWPEGRIEAYAGKIHNMQKAGRSKLPRVRRKKR